MIALHLYTQTLEDYHESFTITQKTHIATCSLYGISVSDARKLQDWKQWITVRFVHYILVNISADLLWSFSTSETISIPERILARNYWSFKNRPTYNTPEVYDTTKNPLPVKNQEFICKFLWVLYHDLIVTAFTIEF